ncbi:hypothetical protein D3C76_844460 [compost metagenome]
MLTAIQRLQILAGEVALQGTVGVDQVVRAIGVFQLAVVALATDGHLCARWQQVEHLARIGLVANAQPRLLIPWMAVVDRVLDPAHSRLGPEHRTRHGHIVPVQRPVL